MTQRAADSSPRTSSAALSRPPLGAQPADGLGEALVRARVRERMFGETSPPPRLDRYAVLEQLGEGRHGLVYAAYDVRLDRKVALKVLRLQTDDRARRRLVLEAKALAKVSHPNIIAVFDVVELPDDHRASLQPQVMIAMEYVRGQSLAQWKHTHHDWREVLGVYLQAARGLMAAHEQQLIHRDFKPANAILGEDGRLRVVDFGLAQKGECHPVAGLADTAAESDESLAYAVSRIVGTPLYMPPEQHRGENASYKSDQYSLCASIWEALYGRPPFVGDSMATLLEAKLAPPVSLDSDPSGVPSRIRDVLIRGLAPVPRERHRDIAALVDALRSDPAVRKRWVVAAGLLIAVSAGFALRPDALDPCDTAAASIDAIWSGDRREMARQAFIATEQSYAESTWRSVEAAVTPWAQAWRTEQRDACAAHQQGVQSDKLFDLRSHCLQSALTALDAQVELWTVSDQTTLDKAGIAARSLPALPLCPDAARLYARTPWPKDPVEVARLKAWDATLARAKANRVSGHYQRGLALADTVVTEYLSSGFDYPPTHARGLIERGSAHAFLTHPNEARADLETGAYTASAAGEDIAFARASARLVGVVGGIEAQLNLAQTWAHLGWAALDRGGADPRIACALHNNLANAFEVNGQYDRAMSEHERRRALVIEHWGPDDPMMIHSIANIASILTAQGDYAGALENLQDVRSRISASFGKTHPLDLGVRSNILGLLVQLDRAQEAIELGELTIADQARVLGPTHTSRAFTQTNLALALHGRRRFDEALTALTEARATLATAFGANAHQLYPVGLIRSRVLISLERFDEARVHAQATKTLGMGALGPEHPQLAHADELLGQIELETKHFGLSLEHLALARDHFGRAGNQTAVHGVKLLEVRALLGQGQAARAHQHASEVAEALAAEVENETLAEAWTLAGVARLAEQTPATARPWLTRAARLYTKLELPPPDELTAALARCDAQAP